MDQSLSKREQPQNDQLIFLQKEIEELETALDKVKTDLSAFETAIQIKLQEQILRVRELTALYKKQKGEKKAKRLEQKKRGKNYKEPNQLKLLSKPKEEEKTPNVAEKNELKRLYKEAVVYIHPDKFHQSGEAEIQRATSITAQLNGIYKRGDLEELINLYQYIISESSGELTQKNTFSEKIADPKVRIAFLKKKKEEISTQLEQLKSSYTYQVLTTYQNPHSFIEDLRLQFQERIAQLEKRTRKK